jgi:signal transduction histidine kinase
MWTSTLRRLRADDAEVARAASAIEHAVGMARRTLENLSDIGRLESGSVELHRDTLDLRDVVRREIARHRAALHQGRVTLVEELPPENVPVSGDATRLALALGNLLDNAIKFSAPDGTVTVAVRRAADRAEMRVVDSGAGLPAEVVPRLFMPFSQGSNSRGGLGVGLAIARWLLALHGGTVEAIEPESPEGATFVVTLPLRECDAQSA